MSAGLTSFRFFAFFAVFLFHTLHLHMGYLGVTAFFVLSGFLITAILVEMKTTHSGTTYFLHFYARRTLRIFPLYYFYLLTVVLVLLIFFSGANYQSNPDITGVFKRLPWSLTYTYNIFDMSDAFEHNRIVGHIWSLAVEEQFYLLWPIAIYFTPKKHIKKFLLLVMAAGPLLRYLTACAVEQHWIAGIGDHVGRVIYVSPFSHLDAFATGGYFALYGKSGTTRSIVAFTTVVIGIGVATMTLSGVHKHWSSFGYDIYMTDSYKHLWAYTLFSLLTAHILITIKHGNFLPALMNSPILVYLGNISYGLYIYHIGIIWLLQTNYPQLSTLSIFSLSLISTLSISALSYALFEKKLISLKDKWFSRARP